MGAILVRSHNRCSRKFGIAERYIIHPRDARATASPFLIVLPCESGC